MTTSLAALATLMDPTEPSASLSQLASRHRWLSGTPPPVVSMRDIAARHENPATTRHRFLWYNTFLLEGWTIDLCRIDVLELLVDLTGVAEQDIVRQLGVSPAEILEKAGVGKHQFLKLFDISPDDVANTFKSLFDSLCDSFLASIPILGDAVCHADDVLDDMLSELSLTQLIEKFNITIDMVLDVLDELGLHPLDILMMFCLPTFEVLRLLTGLPIPSEFTIEAKPELNPRAQEIGATVGADYDIVALCEAFSDNRRQLIRHHAQMTSSQTVHQAVGPDDSGPNTLADSGLYTLAFGRTLTSASTVYHARGDLQRDADAWANKGVLLTRIDVGLGFLEIFSTHLIAGGGLISVPEWIPLLGNIFPEPTDAETLAVQKSQLQELVKFYHAHHIPQNVAMIVGDFNMSAQNADDYPALLQVMTALNMLDAWPYHRHRDHPGPQDNTDIPRGDTHADKDEKHSAVGEVCHLPSPGNIYCNDAVQTNRNTSRIDYIFIEKPQPEHTFMLDFTRIQRRPFPRPYATGDQEHFLSDHLGLDTLLIVSPK